MTGQQRDDNNFPFPAFRMGTVHKVAYTGVSAAIAAAVSEECRLAMVWCSTDAHIAIGAAPTAAATDRPVTAKVDVLIALEEDEKVAAIQQSAGGDLYVTELL